MISKRLHPASFSNVNAQLAQKVQNFKLKNEVVNGDFSQGTTGWVVNNATATVLENTYVATSTSGVIIINSQNFAVGLSDKLYYRFLAEGSKTTSDFQIQFRCDNYYGSLFTNVVYTSLTALVEKLFSGVVVGNGIQSVSNFIVRTSTEYVSGDTLKLKKVAIVNLTKVFGAGNEPSKLEMDELMKVIPNNWWDGELTLTQKQFITWQLNLIRKNTNAIIALGGTII